MKKKPSVLAIVGSYRKGGTIDTAVDEMIYAARRAGAETEKRYLIDKHIGFCTNCRDCTQLRGPQPGICATEDDMCEILEAIDSADALIIGSPVNFSTVTAVTKRFIERLICFAYWPWGRKGPEPRKKEKLKPAVVVGSSAAPALITRLFTNNVKLLKKAADLMGFRTVGVLFIGGAAQKKHPNIDAATRQKARVLGEKLVRPPHYGVIESDAP